MNGAGTCIRYPCNDLGYNDLSFAFPSSRSVALYTEIEGIGLSSDPKGLIYMPAWHDMDAEGTISKMFPDLGYWSCLYRSADETHSTALYLTVTSTSTEPEDGAYEPSYSRSVPSPDEEAASTRELPPLESAASATTEYISSAPSSTHAKVASTLVETPSYQETLSKPAPEASVLAEAPGSDSLRTSTNIAPPHLFAIKYNTALAAIKAATTSVEFAGGSTNEHRDSVGSTTQPLAVVITSIDAPGSSSAVIPVIKASTTLSDETTPIILISPPHFYQRQLSISHLWTGNRP